MSINLVLMLTWKKDHYNSQSKHESHPECQVRWFPKFTKPPNQL